MKDFLKKKFKNINIELTERQTEQFISYYELLIEWNKVMNLTAITKFEEVVEKHFVDSVCIVNFVNLKDKKVIDIGTGAGFPGIPLKIVFPEVSVLLMDSLAKRVKFLNEVINKLKLDKIETLHGRAEDYAQQYAYRESFDLCVSRAVANLSILSEYCIPYVKVGGSFVSYKSGEVESEVNASRNAVTKLGGSISDIIKFQLPETEIGRSFVFISKNVNTSKKYPRKSGLPGKIPLS